MEQKVYYIGYYSDKINKFREGSPAADIKMSYIVEALKKQGYEVEILSLCGVDERKSFLKKHKGYCIEDGEVKVRFFECFNSSNILVRVFTRIISSNKIRKYLKNNITKNDSVLIYHSLSSMHLYGLLKRLAKKVVIEAEEIYSDVLDDSKKKQGEIRKLQTADGYIFPTVLLSEVVNKRKKPEIYIHGTYRVEADRKCNVLCADDHIKDGSVIHCVYAGTFDPRKGGAIAAAAAAEFLPDNYHIHILGFGSDEVIQNMKDTISGIASRSKAKVTYDGCLFGEDYIRFIQGCDVGLSTQNPDASFNSTSFPSKILSYMANGLRVVSVRIPAIEKSAIGDYMYYYEKQTPEEIAKAILSVDMSENYDSRKIIEGLDLSFRSDIKGLLNND